MDVQNSLVDAIYRLGFQNLGDLSAADTYVTSAELFQWADEAAKKLAYRAGVFVTLDTSITVAPGTAAYTLPAAHVFTLHAWLGAAPLRITRQAELEAIDATWAATAGPATRISFDAREVGIAVLYPNPTGGGVLSQVAQEFPATAQSGSVMPLPTAFQDFFSYAMLAGARGKESDAAMPEVAGHAAARMEMYIQIALHLYGRGQ